MYEINRLGGDINSERQVLSSGYLRVDLLKCQVSYQDKAVKLPNLSYKLLVNLMASWPETVSQEQLIKTIWLKTRIQQSTLNQRVKLLRQALQENNCDPSCIALVRGEGYRFSNEVSQQVIPDQPPISPIKAKNIKRKTYLNYGLMVIFIMFFLTLFNWSALPINASIVNESTVKEIKRKTLTIVPFKTANKINFQDYYLSQSFSNELLTALTEINALQIIAHDFSAREKLAQLSTMEIGQLLNVEHVIQGTISQKNDEININVQLLSTEQLEVMWSRSYYIEDNGIYSLKYTIARDIQKALLPKNTEQFTLQTQPDLVNPKAYDLYLKAMNYHNRHNIEGNVNANKLLKEAYQLSPYCPDIITGYAMVVNEGASIGNVDTTLDYAAELARKAIDLYPDHSTGYSVLGLNYLQRKKYDDAQNYFKKALLRNNENINALMGITSLQIKNKESNKALSNIKLLELLDPSSSNSQLLLAQLHFSLEEYNLS